jgi:hypothetical protein
MRVPRLCGRPPVGGRSVRVVGQIVDARADCGRRYNEYDFHAETKGMKYENIAHLIEKMERTFEAQGCASPSS